MKSDEIGLALVGCGLGIALGLIRVAVFTWLLYIITKAAAPSYLWLVWTVLIVSLLSVLVEAVLRGSKVIKD